MTAKPVGGRGKTAPYDTKQMRVPIPLEPQVKELIERYYQWIDDSGHHIFGASNPPKLLDKAVDNLIGTKPVDKLLEVQAEVSNKHKLVDSLRTEVEDASKVVDELVDGLSVRGLAKRLSLGHAVVQQYKTKDSFTEWSKSHDPDGIAWRFDAESKRLFPI